MPTWLCVYWCMLALFMVRLEVTYRARSRHLKSFDERFKGDVSFEDLLRFNQHFQNLPAFGAMLLDLRKWTYKQFFPEAA